MFVTLATEKVQRLLPEEALKAARGRSGCTGKRKQGGRKGKGGCGECWTSNGGEHRWEGTPLVYQRNPQKSLKRVTSEGCSAERRRETDGSVAVTRALDSVRKQNIS